MKTMVMFSTDAYNEAVKQADDLELSHKPNILDDPDYYEWGEAYFDIEKVQLFNIDGKGNITVRFHGDDSYTFQYTPELWEKLINRYE